MMRKGKQNFDYSCHKICDAHVVLFANTSRSERSSEN